MPFDVIFGNAVFQWVPDHLAVLVRLFATCPPGGALAIQVPDNLNEPTHMLMAAVARSGPWRDEVRSSRSGATPFRRRPHTTTG